MRSFYTLCLLFAIGSMIGQDIHFTQFTYAPQSYNPSLIGGYSGTYRAGAIARTQEYGGDAKGYQTLEINVDAPIIKGIRDQDWIGVGVSFDQDTRGTLRMKESLTRLGAAYHIGLDKKSNRYFSIGVQFLNTSRSLPQMGPDGGLITAGTIVTGQITDPDVEAAFGAGNAEDAQASFKDWAVGFSYTAKSRKGNYKIGIATSQFLKNKVGFDQAIDDPFKLMAFYQGYRIINKKLAIEPALVIQNISSGAGFEVSLHNMFSYKIKKDSDLRLKGGLGLRTGSFAGQFLVGASYKGFHGGFAYDIPVNGVQEASGVQNYFELALGYIGVINKTPKPEPLILCPRL